MTTKIFELIPKSGKGARWYMLADQLFKGPLVKAFSKDGFETIVNLNLYDIVK